MVNLVHTLNEDKTIFVPSYTNISSVKSFYLSQLTDTVMLQNEKIFKCIVCNHLENAV